MIVLALGYLLSASQIQTSFLSDPVGPRTFPYLIAAVIILCGISMILRPDPDADWPDGQMVMQLGIAFVVLLGYAFAISPLGFLLPTAIVSGILSWQIAGNPVRSAITGVGLSIGLYLLFAKLLGLSLRGLPAGWGM